MWKRTAMALAIGVSMSACASVISGSSQTLPVSANIPNAIVEVRNKAGDVVYRGGTPARIELDRSRGYFAPEDYTVTVSAEGYEPYTVELDPNINPWAFGSLVTTGPVGLLIVDPLTGANITHVPTRVEAELNRSARPVLAQPSTPVQRPPQPQQQRPIPRPPGYATSSYIEIKSIYDLTPEERKALLEKQGSPN